VAGKIVLYNPAWEGYGQTVTYSSSGASRAAELGAVAVLVRSMPGFGVRTVGIHYFDWRHTNADSFDKIVPREFQLNVAWLAVLSYVLADMPERLSDLR